MVSNGKCKNLFGGGKNMANKDQGVGIPLTPPGYRPTGNLLTDLNRMYGSRALKSGKVRAALRRKYPGEIEVKQINGEWCLYPKKKQTSLDK
jgi:hypothetical protein